MSFITINKEQPINGTGLSNFHLVSCTENQNHKELNHNHTMNTEIENNQNGESDGQRKNKKQVKTVPIQIVPNHLGIQRTGKFKKCQLRFTGYMKAKEQPQIENQTTLPIPQPQVTIPLQFFQQLVQQALYNKQLSSQISSSLNDTKSSREDKLDETFPKKNNKIYEELLQQLQTQSKQYQPPQSTEQRTYIRPFIELHDTFIKTSEFSRQIINSFFHEAPQYIKFFFNWYNQQKLQTVEELLLVCNQKTQQLIIDEFQKLFKVLLFEFYSKHAFVVIMQSDFPEKMNFLQQIGEILNKIMHPSDYYVFPKDTPQK